MRAAGFFLAVSLLVIAVRFAAAWRRGARNAGERIVVAFLRGAGTRTLVNGHPARPQYPVRPRRRRRKQKPALRMRP